MATRTSTRQAAQKAKEAIAAAPDVKSRGTAGAKRKGSADKGVDTKRSKKEADKELNEAQKPAAGTKAQAPKDYSNEVDKPETKLEKAEEKSMDKPEKPDEEPDGKLEEKPENESEDKAEEKPKADSEKQAEEPSEEKPQAKSETEQAKEPNESNADEKPEDKMEVDDEEKPKDVQAEDKEENPASTKDTEAGVQTSQEREEKVPSNILEKGIIYFFYRSRVNVTDPQSVDDVARTFVVLRPTPLGATLDAKQGPVDTGAKCRLMALPKKRFPTSGRDRVMGFVEKAGHSMKALQESFIAGDHYDTATQGERTVPDARPYAEGVYAITSTKRTSHLAYVLTIPDQIGSLQEDFGLRSRGSWVVQSKNPKHPGPSYAQLPKDPEYPDSVLAKFGDYRWRPLEPEFIDYPNAQFLVVGEAVDELGKAATAEEDGKKADEVQPVEELELLEQENEERVESLRGDDTIYEDLGLDAKNYPAVPTTWESQ